MTGNKWFIIRIALVLCAALLLGCFSGCLSPAMISEARAIRIAKRAVWFRAWKDGTLPITLEACRLDQDVYIVSFSAQSKLPGATQYYLVTVDAYSGKRGAVNISA